MATLLDVAGATYPAHARRRRGPARRGPQPAARAATARTARPADLFWEHEGNAAVRVGHWKLVRKHGRPGSSTTSSATAPSARPRGAAPGASSTDLAAQYEAWAQRCGVIPREIVLDLYARRGKGLPPE